MRHGSTFVLFLDIFGAYVVLPQHIFVPSEHIKTHDSESQGQEEAGCTRQMSVLFTGSTEGSATLNFHRRDSESFGILA